MILLRILEDVRQGSTTLEEAETRIRDLFTSPDGAPLVNSELQETYPILFNEDRELHCINVATTAMVRHLGAGEGIAATRVAQYVLERAQEVKLCQTS